MTELGVAIRGKSLYHPRSIKLWRQFDRVVIRNFLSPFFVWADHNNPQSSLAKQHLTRIQRLGCSTHIHGTLPMRRQYLPWWLGGSVTFNPLTKRHIPRSEQIAYPQDVETRLRDFKRVIQHNAAIASELGIGVDVVSQLFDRQGSYRRFGIALLSNAFQWAEESITNPECQTYLNEVLGTSQERWDSILDKLKNNPHINALSLQIHHPIGEGLDQQLELCAYVCQATKQQGISINFSEMQFWLSHDTEETPESEDEWSRWHRAFYDLAEQYQSPSYVIWGLSDDGMAQLPLGGHGQNAFNYNKDPKPFVKEVLNLE